MSIAPEALDYSIVICTYNPDERILTRCLQAVLQLSRTDISTEVILVDNNSTTPLDTLPYVQKYLAQIPGIRFLLVKEQGLVHARMAAIQAARGTFIVYFDDDNEPESDYLQQLKQLNTTYPQVAAWGPGNISVDFPDGIEEGLHAYALSAFQERHEQHIAYACVRDWQGCYPFGTGICVYAFLQREYLQLTEQGRFTQSGRKGKLLTSGDDTQMVLHCINRGYAAGVAPALRLKHLIPAARANYAYLQKLTYGTSICYDTCLLQVFPDRKPVVEQQLLAPTKFSRQALKKYLKAKWSSKPLKTLQLIQYIGSQQSKYLALDRPVPQGVQRVLQKLKLI